jgi:hypothetical protein
LQFLVVSMRQFNPQQSSIFRSDRLNRTRVTRGAERRAYVIADNKLALNAGWDREMLAIELQGLVDLDFEIELTGFSLAEVDIVLDEARESATDSADASIEDSIPTYRQEGPTVTQPGDLWMLGRHKTHVRRCARRGRLCSASG